MTQEYDQPYTPEIVRKILEVLPDLMSCRNSGMMQLNFRHSTKRTLEDKLAIETAQGLAPRPSRRSNTVYQIDNVAAIVIDLERALKFALSDFQRELLLCRFARGFSKREIAQALNITVGTVKYHTKVAVEAISQYLERHKKPTSFKRYVGESYSHTRTYASAGVAL